MPPPFTIWSGTTLANVRSAMAETIAMKMELGERK
jgi:hypothetical protein